jgi:putative spermidine/putrescine transport system substrate-binding protein
MIIWDESSAEAVAKLRAMNEAGNITWDLVDVVALTPSACATKACNGNRSDEDLAAAMTAPRHPMTFGDLIVSDCFIPQIVYSTTFGYRTDVVGLDTPKTTTSATSSTWKPSRASGR